MVLENGVMKVDLLNGVKLERGIKWKNVEK